MNKKLNNSELNSETHSSFECVSSDHQIVTANICLSLRRNAEQITKTAHYNWSLLNCIYICNKFTIALRNKFDSLQEILETLTSNDEYEKFVNAHMEAATEYEYQPN